MKTSKKGKPGVVQRTWIHCSARERKHLGQSSVYWIWGGIGRGRFERSAGTRFSKDLNHSEEFVASVIMRNYMILL